MIEQYQKIALWIKEYPLFPEEYHYMVEDIQFTKYTGEDTGRYMYEYGGEKVDIILIPMMFDLNNPIEIWVLLGVIFHEVAHRIQIKRHYEEVEEHGKEFQEICKEVGLPPTGRPSGNEEKDVKYQFYVWSARRVSHSN